MRRPGLSPALRTLDQHLAEQNRQARDGTNRPNASTHPKTWAPEAPLPKDPTSCRWCGGALKALIEGDPIDYCQSGCAKNDVAPYLGYCERCRRQFYTGKRDVIWCFDCDQKDAAEHAHGYTSAGRRPDRFADRQREFAREDRERGQ